MFCFIVVCKPLAIQTVINSFLVLLNKVSPFGVDFELCNLADLLFKQKHYRLTKVEKVKKHNRTPLKS